MPFFKESYQMNETQLRQKMQWKQERKQHLRAAENGIAQFKSSLNALQLTITLQSDQKWFDHSYIDQKLFFIQQRSELLKRKIRHYYGDGIRYVDINYELTLLKKEIAELLALAEQRLQLVKDKVACSQKVDEQVAPEMVTTNLSFFSFFCCSFEPDPALENKSYSSIPSYRS